MPAFLGGIATRYLESTFSKIFPVSGKVSVEMPAFLGGIATV